MDDEATPRFMSQFGKLPEYHSDTEGIAAYLERVELFFAANDVAENKRVAIFLSSVGGKTYSLSRDLLAPDKPSTKSLDELFVALKTHYAPQPIVIAERFYFHKRNQTVNESIADYLAALRQLATHCAFGNFLDDALRDRLVCGLRSSAIQKRLLSEKDLTLTTAVKLAQSMEAADANVTKLQIGEASAPINRTETATKKTCYRCGGHSHAPGDCRFREYTCNKCKKKGHLAKMCRKPDQAEMPSPPPQKGRKPPQAGAQHKSRNSRQYRQTNTIREPIAEDTIAPLFNVNGKSANPITVALDVNSKKLSMEVDTGAAVSVISEETRAHLFPSMKVKDTSVILTTYTGEQMAVAGEVTVTVIYRQKQHLLTLCVVKGDGPSLLGRDWLYQLNLDIQGLWKTSVVYPQSADATTQRDRLLSKYDEVFRDKPGEINTFEATLHLKESAVPKFCKARTVPFALKEAIKQELNRLEQDSIIEKVTYSPWAAPIVPVPKGDGRIRLCGDYKVTINPMLEIDKYPLPKPDDIFATLAGGRYFSKIDLTHAYQQLKLSESSRELVTVNTHRGLYRYTRLPFGVASAPAIFQKVMDTVLQGLSGVICYLDDILVSGTTEEENLKNVEHVLTRLQQYGITAKKEKCVFLATTVEYLGHKVDATGVHTLSSKVAAITKAPKPRNIQELRSFLGLIHYYHKFLPNLSTLLHPLNDLLKAGNKWIWSKDCSDVFRKAKQLLVSAPVLAHFDPSLPIKLAGDASAYGIGAAISHVLPNGQERPIAFASSTLSFAERNYGQIEKEALSLVYGIHKFHQYLYGRKFVLVTDHKPLLTLLGPKKGIPSLAAARLQRWAVLLSAYVYDIEFRPTDEHSNVDALSRLPLKVNYIPALDVDNSFMIGQVQALPVVAEEIAAATRTDPLLSKIYRYVQKGWPCKITDEERPYWRRYKELSTESGCLMWGNRVIVPQKFQNKLVAELHQDHPGGARMKSVARSYFWWPGLDKVIEGQAKSCEACQAVKSCTATAPLHPWLWPERPWQRVHIDFAGPFMNRTFLILTDAHSKWPEVIEMNSTTAGRTIVELRRLFSSYGLPEQLVSDNGPQFVSDEFSTFMKMNGIKHIRCSPYHPSSNGAAERFVQTFKKAMKASQHSSLSFSHRLSNFLFTYRCTQHATTNEAPCQLFIGRMLRTRFDLLHPSDNRRVNNKQADQKAYHDRKAKERSLRIGQRVVVRNQIPGRPWVPGIVEEMQGPLTYLICLDTGQRWKRHVDHVREIGGSNDEHDEQNFSRTIDTEVFDAPMPTDNGSTNNTPPMAESGTESSESVVSSSTNVEPSSTEDVPSRRYPQRIRKPNPRYTS